MGARHSAAAHGAADGQEHRLQAAPVKGDVDAVVLDVKAGDVVRSDEGHVSLPFVAVFRVDQFYRRGRGHAQIGYHGCKLLGERAAHVGRYSHVCPRSCRCRQGSVGLACPRRAMSSAGGRARHGRSTAQRCRLHRRRQRARYVRRARCGYLGRTARSPAADARARRGHGRRFGEARRAARIPSVVYSITACFQAAWT